MSAPVTLPVPPARPNRRRRWPKVLAGAVVLLLLAAWFAPAVVARTSLRNRIARRAAADLNGTLDVGGASLGWLSRVELRDVTLTDAQGRVVARIPKVTSGRTLLGLLRDPSNPGEFTLDRPAVEVVCGPHGTNVEDVFRKFIEDVGPPAATRTPVTVRVTDGTLTLRDGDRTGEFRGIDATVSVPAARAEPVAVRLAANAPGRVEVDASVGESGSLKLASGGLALESLAPLLRRADPTLAVTGTLTADAAVTWAKDAVAVDGTLGVKNLAVASPVLRGDTLKLASADLPLKASLTGRVVRVERAELTSDVGTLSVVGTFDPSESLGTLLDRAGAKFDARVDVARLAAMFPKLLQLREGVEFRSGDLTVTAESKAGPDGTSWTGSVTTSDLKATRGGRDIHWEQPLAVEFAGRFKAGELPTFDTLTCRSDFVAINAEVKPNSVRAAANVFLDRLAARLSDFVDLGGAKLDGRGTATLVVTRTPTGEFRGSAGLELTQFEFTDGAGRGIREPSLKLQLAATGTAPDAGPVAVSAASLGLTAGPDELKLTLLEPIPDAKKLAGGKLDAALSGELNRWKRRFALLTPVLNDYQVRGNATARGVVRFAPDLVRVDRLTLNVDQAKFVGAGLDVDEPNLNAVADLTVDRAAGTATFDDFTINSAPLSVVRGKLVIESPPNGPFVVHGGGPATTKLNRLGKSVGMFGDPNGPTAVRGAGTGPVHFRYMGDVTTFAGTLDVANFSFGPRDRPDWVEPTLRLELDGSYTRSTDTVAFKAAKLDRPGLGLSAAGSIGKFDTTTDTNLAGTLTYDMAKLSPKLRELLGGDFAAKGKGTKPVSFAGSLTPVAGPGAKTPPSMFTGATGEFALGWDSAHAYGFAMGPGELRAKLANGVARVAPVTATYGGGKVTVHPTVRLDPPPGVVTLAKGLIVDRAKLTPGSTAGAVGYALPAIANAAKAEGEVSVQLDDNRIPLGDPRKATLKGTVTIHKATVTAGPVVTVVAKLLGADSGTMTLANDQAVPVRVGNGRVFHENLSVKVGGYLVKTSGSVGFDGTLDLVADVPIPGGLPGLKNTPLLAKALTGKRVQVPINGTLSAPALDPQAFQAAVARLAEGAAKDVGRDLLNKELDKLFPGMPGPKPGGLFPFPPPKK